MALETDAMVPMLEAALRGAGVLPRGAIAEIAARRDPTFTSASYHVAVRYRGDAPPDAPRALLLKRHHAHAGAREVALYRLARREEHAPLPLLPCYEATYDPDTGASRLLLADLAGSHRPVATTARLMAGEAMPSRQTLRRLLRALACFHAHWWNDPRLGSDDTPFELHPWYGSAARFEATAQRWRREWRQFRGSVGAGIPHSWAARYERALDRLPQLWERYLAPRIEERRFLALAHGNATFAAFLAPRTAGRGPLPNGGRSRIYLVDLEAVSASFAAFDLATLLPTFWTPAQQQLTTGYALRHYHRALLAQGVRGYTLRQLHDDYRLMRYLLRFDAVSNALQGASESYWRVKMGNLLGGQRPAA